MTSSLNILIERFTNGRTDLVYDLLKAGLNAGDDVAGVPFIVHSAYYGDVSAVRLLLQNGANLEQLGKDHGLINASFHGHWQLCQFLLESGADANYNASESKETPLHAALCTVSRTRHDRVLQVLLAFGADPDIATQAGVETGGFMRDVRTKGETPLHRAAAFGTLHTIDLLLAAGAHLDARDMNGDSPLSWASWHLRTTEILRKLLFGNYRIHPEHAGMEAHLTGKP